MRLSTRRRTAGTWGTAPRSATGSFHAGADPRERGCRGVVAHILNLCYLKRGYIKHGNLERRMASVRESTPNGSGTTPSGMTIEQLAAEVGMSVRNIRNHHSRGLLAPPEVRARIGYYDSGHVERLRLIQDLQADGFNPAAIERLLSGSGGLAAKLIGLRAAVTAPFDPESPEIVTGEELLERFGEAD